MVLPTNFYSDIFVFLFEIRERMVLSDLQTGNSAIIAKVKGHGAFRKRITEMGFIRGKRVTVIKNAPLKDPIEYKILDYDVSLRRSEALLIEVVDHNDAIALLNGSFEGTITEDLVRSKALEKGKTINIALVGNPNCGKTTLFNYASGSKEHVGNYSGVTVDIKTAFFNQGDYSFNITDLPGTYSITAYSPEELYVRNFIINEAPDVIVNVIDASNLERNLYLTTQLIDMDVKVVVALNMYDELLKKGAHFDYHALAEMIGIPFVPTVSSKGKGINNLFSKVIEVFEDQAPVARHIHINYGQTIEDSINTLQPKLKTPENYSIFDQISSRFVAIKLLEKDREINKFADKLSNAPKIRELARNERNRIRKILQDDSETALTDARYGFISGALKETYRESLVKRRRKTEMVDTFLTHKVFGYPIFIFFMWLTFQSTFWLGKFPMDWIDHGVQYLGQTIQNHMENGMLKDLISDGIIGGVGSVIVFLPNILILFFFISLMEDTGYMARIAFIMDKIMHRIGLHGKSFIPLMMGFGCNVPAIMATRTLENRNDRILTILINPFMSCSARLPVYLIIIAAIFPENAGTILFSLYIFGIALAALMAILFKNLIFRSKEAPFVMELPPYRMPTIRTTTRHMWNKGQQYLQKMGGIILIASILIWALGYFPRSSDETKAIQKKLIHLEKANIKNIKMSEKAQFKNDADIKKSKDSLLLLIEKSRRENSYIGMIGKSIEPALAPLGFDWKMSVSILSGIAAKEVVVSTLGVLYQASAKADVNSSGLKQAINEDKHFNKLSALSFLLFVLIYFPCIAVVAAVKKETGHWKWALFMIGYTTLLAWFVGFLVYQVGSLLG
jgi:ferrous iron transport protein B